MVFFLFFIYLFYFIFLFLMGGGGCVMNKSIIQFYIYFAKMPI